MVSKKELEMTVFEKYGRQAIGFLMAQDGVVYTAESENKIIGQMFEYMLKYGYTRKSANYYLNYDEDFIADNLQMLPRV
jgi:hypothetical protein